MRTCMRVSMLNLFLILFPSFAQPDSAKIFWEDFEKDLSGWSLRDDNPKEGKDYWGLVSGTLYGKSLWCAASTDNDCKPYGDGRHYDNEMMAFLERSVDLSEYTSATLRFDYCINTEAGFDFLKVYINGKQVFFRSGYANWDPKKNGPEKEGYQRYIDLSEFCGESSVTISFVFESDRANNGEKIKEGLVGSVGAFLDNILVSGQK